MLGNYIYRVSSRSHCIKHTRIYIFTLNVKTIVRRTKICCHNYNKNAVGRFMPTFKWPKRVRVCARGREHEWKWKLGFVPQTNSKSIYLHGLFRNLDLINNLTVITNHSQFIVTISWHLFIYFFYKNANIQIWIHRDAHAFV